MTEQEAINILQLNTPFVASKEANEAIDMAIKALEKQIAKKPTKEPYLFVSGSSLFCPTCEEIVLEGEKYCNNCGQKLD